MIKKINPPQLGAVTQELLELISNPEVGFSGAYNVREDSGCAGRHSTDNILIENNKENTGINIHIAPNTTGETVYIPAILTKSAVTDLVYNDFYIGENADITIMAGCGVHSDGVEASTHDGIHRFYIGKNAKVRYLENHVGVGDGTGERNINPVTEIFIQDGGSMEMETTQMEGVNHSKRVTTAAVEVGGNFIVKEAMMTGGQEYVSSDFNVDLNGDGSGAHIISRSVAKGHSEQLFTMKISGNAACNGHAECDAIIMEHGTVTALPGLVASHSDAQLIHEAAIGKIAGDQLIKLMTLGLTEGEAEEAIIKGFLS